MRYPEHVLVVLASTLAEDAALQEKWLMTEARALPGDGAVRSGVGGGGGGGGGGGVE